MLTILWIAGRIMGGWFDRFLCCVVNGIDVDKWIEVIELTFNIAISGNTKNDNDKCVDAWFDNQMSSLTWQQKRKLSFENYMTYIKTNSSIKEIIGKYNLNKN